VRGPAVSFTGINILQDQLIFLLVSQSFFFVEKTQCDGEIRHIVVCKALGYHETGIPLLIYDHMSC
jgi:hypothetical protein